MSTFRTCVLSVLLVPTLALGAAEKMAPTKSNPPPVATSGLYLVDKTIPAYGVVNQVPHYSESRANSLYLEIHQVLADVESQVMSGAAAHAQPTSKKDKDAAPAPVGDARVGDLLNRLVELDARIAYRTYLEQWQIDNSFSDLGRAADLMALNGQVASATSEKVKDAKAKAAPKTDAPAAPKDDAPAAKPEAPAPKPEAPAAKPDAPAAPAPEAPAAPAAPAPVPAAPAPDAPAAPAVPAADAPAAPAAPAVPAADAPAAPAVPAADAPAAPAAAAVPAADAPAAPAAPPAVEPPPAEKADK